MVDFNNIPADIIYLFLQTASATSINDAIYLSQVNRNVRAISIPVIFRTLSLSGETEAPSDLVMGLERYDVATVRANTRILSVVRWV